MSLTALETSEQERSSVYDNRDKTSTTEGSVVGRSALNSDRRLAHRPEVLMLWAHRNTVADSEKVTISVTLAELDTQRSDGAYLEPIETARGFVEPATRIERDDLSSVRL